MQIIPNLTIHLHLRWYFSKLFSGYRAFIHWPPGLFTSIFNLFFVSIYWMSTVFLAELLLKNYDPNGTWSQVKINQLKWNASISIESSMFVWMIRFFSVLNDNETSSQFNYGACLFLIDNLRHFAILFTRFLSAKFQFVNCQLKKKFPTITAIWRKNGTFFTNYFFAKLRTFFVNNFLQHLMLMNWRKKKKLNFLFTRLASQRNMNPVSQSKRLRSRLAFRKPNPTNYHLD